MQNSSDDHNGGAQENHLSSTKGITNEDSYNRATEAAQVITGDGDTLNSRDMVGIGILDCVDFRKRGNPARQRNKTRHNTLAMKLES